MFIRVVFYIIGLLWIGLGNAFIINSLIGAGPFDALFVGLNLHFGLTIGILGIIGQIFIIFLTAFISFSRPKFESFITIVLRGIFFDLWFYILLSPLLLTVFYEAMAYFYFFQWLVFFIGLLILSIGTGTYLVSDFPKTPVDGLMFAVSKRFSLSLRNARISIDSFVVIVAFLLGGPVGLGTIVIALLLGRLVQYFHQKSKKIFFSFNNQKKATESL